MQMDVEIVVERPVEEVFAYWADLENGPEWAEPVIERRKLTQGPVGLGTRFHGVDRFPGRRLEFEVEVTEFEPNTRMAARIGEPMNGTWEAEFSPENGSTRLHLIANVSPPGPLKVLAPVMGSWMKRAIEKDLLSFKENLEAQARG